jgi:hypothetical protein
MAHHSQYAFLVTAHLNCQNTTTHHPVNETIFLCYSKHRSCGTAKKWWRTLYVRYGTANGTFMNIRFCSETPFVGNCFCFWRDSPLWTRDSSFTRFLDHTQRHTTVGRTPLYERSARRRDLYLTTHKTHNRHPCPPRWDSNPQSQQASSRRRP